MGETPNFDTNTTTIEFFFRLDSKPSADYNPCLVAKRASSGETRFSVHIASDLSSLMVWNGHLLALGLLPTGAYVVGEWYHFTLVLGATTCLMYVNGVELDVKASTPLNVSQKNRPLMVGASDLSGSEPSVFSIAELAIYGDALSSKSIAAHIAAAGWTAKSKKLAEIAKKQKELATKGKAEKTAKRLADKRLFAQGKTRNYEGEHLEAIMFGVGGIGAGTIQMNGKAEGAVWQIFNNFTQVTVPQSFLAIEVNGVKKALRTSKVGFLRRNGLLEIPRRVSLRLV